MKKIIYVLLLVVSVFGFSSCGGSAVASDDTHTAAGNNSDNEDNDEDATDNPVIAYGNMLVVYYSFTNNTHAVVSDLLTQIDADVVRVEPTEKGLDYAANNYAIGSALISAIRENPDDASSYPDIDSVDVQLDNYDTVIVAAPLWWSSMAAPLQTSQKPRCRCLQRGFLFVLSYICHTAVRK